VYEFGATADVTDKVFDRHIDVNLRAPTGGDAEARAAYLATVPSGEPVSPKKPPPPSPTSAHRKPVISSAQTIYVDGGMTAA